MKTINTIIVVMFAIVFGSVVANAQEVSITEAEFTEAILGGTTNSKGCYHRWFEEGLPHFENCNGFMVGANVGYTSTSFSNNETSGTSGSVKYGVSVAYRHNMFRPEISFAMQQMNIEGRSYNAPELNLALNIDFNRHSRVNVYAAPTVGYKFVQSKKSITTEDYELNIPYDGNVLVYGGKVGAMIKLGAPAKAHVKNVKGLNVKYYTHGQLFLKAEASFQTGSVSKPAGDKLNMNEFGASVSLVYKF